MVMFIIISTYFLFHRFNGRISIRSILPPFSHFFFFYSIVLLLHTHVYNKPCLYRSDNTTI